MLAPVVAALQALTAAAEFVAAAVIAVAVAVEGLELILQSIRKLGAGGKH